MSLSQTFQKIFPHSDQRRPLEARRLSRYKLLTVFSAAALLCSSFSLSAQAQDSNGIYSLNQSGSSVGFELNTTIQTIGGTIGPGGNLSFNANGFYNNSDSPNVGGSLFLGGSLRGDTGRSKALLKGSGNVSGGVMVDPSNNVGVGLADSATPGAKLEVNGNLLLSSGSGASVTFADGTVQSTAWNGVLTGGDYAESVNVSGAREDYEPGDVLVIDPRSDGQFLKSSVPYATTVTGIYSTRPGVIGRRQLTARANMKEEVPMAMTGIVPTKVSAENGPIKPGDLLVTSSRPGYAMKGTDRSQMLGSVIGKAIGHLDSGAGVIEAVVALQ